MEYDLHLIRTKKTIKQVKKLLKKEVFGNYDVENTRNQIKQFGVFLFWFDKEKDLLLLKLDYNLQNYSDISSAIINSLYVILQCDCWVVGVVLEYPKAFIRYYKYNGISNKMILDTVLEHADGTQLTPTAQAKWNFDSRDAWTKMKYNMDWEVLRQCIVDGHQYIETYKKQWIDKFGDLKGIKKPFCDSMFFVPTKQVKKLAEEYGEHKPVTVEQVKLGKIELGGGGKIVMETDINMNGKDETTKTIYGADGKPISSVKEIKPDGE